MFVQFVGDEQSCHWYPNAVGLPVHAPRSADSVFPIAGVPLIVGAATLAGGEVGGTEGGVVGMEGGMVGGGAGAPVMLLCDPLTYAERQVARVPPELHDRGSSRRPAPRSVTLRQAALR